MLTKGAFHLSLHVFESLKQPEGVPRLFFWIFESVEGYNVGVIPDIANIAVLLLKTAIFNFFQL